MDHPRNVGIGLDFSSNSKRGLTWATENLIRSGDHVFILIVQPKGSETGLPHLMSLWSETGSPLIPLFEFKEEKIQKDYGLTMDTADVIGVLDNLNLHHDVLINVKIYWGDPKEKLCEAVNKLELHSLVLGSRGQGTLKRALLGSVSNYAVNHAMCPVTVVK
ncbi:hypothetical protein KP509_01G060600 [Ceratopteris richardii]|uniref:UspA domain-containing protein n=1 Tax=Ceratopteris richardii TaxID=49495 RepID=A0A8T2VGR6_CERRI|nr:hypothetical protein KP509_01G060600 [Ceratopteris richardii]